MRYYSEVCVHGLEISHAAIAYVAGHCAYHGSVGEYKRLSALGTGGGGHACASGATVYSREEMQQLIRDADELTQTYKEKNDGWL